jgi:hypothetical protein
MRAIYGNGDTIAMARLFLLSLPVLIYQDEAISWRPRGIAMHLSGARNDIREGLTITGKTVLEFLFLSI